MKLRCGITTEQWQLNHLNYAPTPTTTSRTTVHPALVRYGVTIVFINHVCAASKGMPRMKEIFNQLMAESIIKHQHPDIVARVYAGLQDVCHEFFKWSETKRKEEREKQA